MNRRQFLKGAASLPALSVGYPSMPQTTETGTTQPLCRVRPTDPAWPSEASWDRLRQEVGGRLTAVKSPLDACRTEPEGEACRRLFTELQNPYYIDDAPALTQTSGWLDAWTAQPSVYAVAVATTADVVAAVNFARQHNLRVVVKGGGHSYQGTSNAADSLLIWTRHMDQVVLDAAFVAQGADGKQAPQPAVTIGAGAPPAFPTIRGHEPELAAARRDAAAINRAMEALLKVTGRSGSYVSESDFFERGWQRSFWGRNYPRLARIKRKYDPEGLFFIHHGVGSEEWSADGFARRKRS